MAVEATHLKFFPQQRDLVTSSNQPNAGGSEYNSQQMRFSGIPFGTTFPGNNYLYQPAICDSVQAKSSINTDSGLTYNIPASRKRSREPMNQVYTATNFHATQKNDCSYHVPSYVGEDVYPQFQQYQLEIDNIISQHNKRIRLELEERQKQHARLLVAAIGEGFMKKMMEKDEQIQGMTKLNFVLQERVKSLYVENQLLRDLAHTNEATANSLRSDLEQVLANVGGGEERIPAGAGDLAAAAEEDVGSYCGSNEVAAAAHYREGEEISFYRDRRCRTCGDRESCVLLLPCRHLCLCNVCVVGPHHLQSCPVCNSSVNATLHVNMSS